MAQILLLTLLTLKLDHFPGCHRVCQIFVSHLVVVPVWKQLICEFQNTELRAQYYEVVMLPVHKRALAVAMNSEGPRVCYVVAHIKKS